MLLNDMWVAQRNLEVWRGRLQAGSHGVFMLLARGPAQFTADALAVLRRRASRASASDRIEERIAVLQALVNHIACALATVATASDALRLPLHASPPVLAATAAAEGADAAEPGPLGPGAASGQQQLQQQQAALALAPVQQCLSSIAGALRQLLPEAPELEASAPGRGPPGEGALAGGAVADGKQGDRRSGAPGAVRLGADEVEGLAEVRALLGEVHALLGMAPGEVAPDVAPTGDDAKRQQLQQHERQPKGQQLAERQEGEQEQEQGQQPPGPPWPPQRQAPKDALAALAAAPAIAAQQGSLAPVPRWARMPSHYQRHWVQYAAAGAAAAWAAGFLVRAARSGDLERWAAGGVEVLQGSWRAHVVAPLLTVRDELFRTFRERPSIVSPMEFEADKQSLLRMLDAFVRERPAAAAQAAAARGTAAATPGQSGGSGGGSGSSGGGSSAGSSGADRPAAEAASQGSGSELGLNGDAINRGMAAVMAAYEDELRSPIRNLVAGDLARALLIQVQRLKIDTEAAMLELDQILRANELSISLVAAVPSLLLLAGLLRALWRLLLVRRAPDPKREAVPVRLAILDLERALLEVAARVAGGGSGVQLQEAQGMAVFKSFKVYREAQRLYRLRDRTSRFSEWPYLQADLLQLGRAALPVAARLDLLQRMLRSYTLFQP